MYILYNTQSNTYDINTREYFVEKYKKLDTMALHSLGLHKIDDGWLICANLNISTDDYFAFDIVICKQYPQFVSCVKTERRRQSIINILNNGSC